MGTRLIFRINRQIFRINRQIFLVLSFDLVDQWSAGHEASAGLPASRAAGRLARGVRTLFPTSFYSLQPMRNPCAAQVPDAPLGIPRGAPCEERPPARVAVAVCGGWRLAHLLPLRSPRPAHPTRRVAARRCGVLLTSASKRRRALHGRALRRGGRCKFKARGGRSVWRAGAGWGRPRACACAERGPMTRPPPQMRSACRRVRKTLPSENAPRARATGPCHSVAPYPFLRPTCKQPQLRERSAPCKGPCARACIALRGPTALSRKADGGGAPPRARCDVPARTSFARAGLK